MEGEIERAKAREGELAAEVALGTNTGNPASAALWSDLKDRVLTLDYDARLKCRQLVADTFAQVQIYFRGARPHTPANVLDVLLISKAGVARLLRLDRKTGELLHGLEKV